MTENIIQSFPAHKVDAARRALEQAHRRAVRHAARAGAEGPTAPTLTVLRERVEGRCTECSTIAEGWFGKCLACKRGYVMHRKVVDLELGAPSPRVGGWEFLAVVEPLEGGNLIRQVPGASVAEGELSGWREGSITCDHCNAARRRLETFILRSAEGTYKQVGRNCLEAFLGGKSAAAIISSIGWPTVVAAEGDGEGGWGSSPQVYEPAEFLAWVAAIVRINGWVSAARARDTGSRSTAYFAQYLNTYPFGLEAKIEWEKAREEFRPSDEDRANGKAALTWAADLAGHTDYEANLSLVARQQVLEPSHAGILASAVVAHARMLGEQVKREARAANPSAYLGAVGDKKRNFGRVTIERIASFDSDYGPVHIHTFRDTDGNALVWRTGEAKGTVGEAYMLVGTVKAHSEFRGEKQTELTRCKLEKAA